MIISDALSERCDVGPDLGLQGRYYLRNWDGRAVSLGMNSTAYCSTRYAATVRLQIDSDGTAGKHSGRVSVHNRDSLEPIAEYFLYPDSPSKFAEQDVSALLVTQILVDNDQARVVLSDQAVVLPRRKQ